MLEKIKSKKEYLIIIAVVILIMIPFISNNYVAGDDTDFHMSNIFARYTKLSQGDFSSQKVLSVIGRNFGYGSGIFYPALAHLSTAILSVIFLGNITLSLKIIHFLVYLISAIVMYKLVNTIFKNKYVALIASIFYITFPYSITEVFRRDAFAESLVYIFMPMIMLALFHLVYGEKKYFYLLFVIGYVGLMNSHLVLAVYFTVLVMIYLLINFKKVFTKQNLKALIISSIIILLIVSPFIIPMLQHKMLKIYSVFEGENMANYGTTVNSAMTFDEFVVQETSKKFTTVNYYLNLLALVMSMIAIIINKKVLKNETEKNFFKFLVILTIITTFLMSNLFPWRFAPKMMIMIQFAWRLETILIIALSILSALSVRNIKQRKYKILILAFILIFNAFTVYKTYDFNKIQVRNIEDVDVSYWGMGWEKEYLPLVTINNQDYFNNRTQDIIVKSGNADIEIQENNTPELKAKIENCNEETLIELPRIYYLGYDLTLQNHEGDKQKVETNMNDMGFMEAKISESGILKLKYTGTTANKIANVVSILTIVFSIIAYTYYTKTNRRAVISK